MSKISVDSRLYLKLNKLQNTSTYNFMKINTYTNIHLRKPSRKRNLQPSQLQMNGFLLHFSNEEIFLGLAFNQKFTWSSYCTPQEEMLTLP